MNQPFETGIPWSDATTAGARGGSGRRKLIQAAAAGLVLAALTLTARQKSMVPNAAEVLREVLAGR